jgi:small-conductance mechanosensitive channel
MREVVALLVYLGLGVITLRSMDVEITGLVATSAVITVIVGLAIQQTLGNLLAGLALVWEQRVTIGTFSGSSANSAVQSM